MPQLSPDAVHPADLEACRALLRHGSKSFFAASLLLPRDVRDNATALYAFCRVADDAIDLAPDPRAALLALHDRLDAIYQGGPLHDPVDRAVSAVIAAHALPRAVLDGLLEGFAWDADGRSYDSEADILAYAARVAATVGVLMTLLMGVRQPATLARACDLGLAMQLTNIARDVGEDARNGRLYLPRDWMLEAGLDPDAWLSAPVFDARIGAVVERLLALADTHYDRAHAGIRALPRDCRAAIHAARLVYREIGRQVTANRFDSVSGRTVVSKRRKLALIAQAALADLSPARRMSAFAEPEVAFLLRAVAQERRAPVIAHRSTIWPLAAARGFRNRTLGVLTLIERVEQRRFDLGGGLARTAADL
jgi:15-cis-phytoene synthase